MSSAVHQFNSAPHIAFQIFKENFDVYLTKTQIHLIENIISKRVQTDIQSNPLLNLSLNFTDEKESKIVTPSF